MRQLKIIRNTIEVGDMVEIVDIGKRYSCYQEFFDRYGKHSEYPFIYGSYDAKAKGRRGRVIAKEKHLRRPEEGYLVILNVEETKTCEIYNIEGVKLID